AGTHLLPEAAARNERRLEAVRCSALFGQAPRHVSLAPVCPHVYWITLSACNRSAGGMAKPNALAVWRLMTNSNFVGRSTGRSAGFAPWKILATNIAARRARSRGSSA